MKTLVLPAILLAYSLLPAQELLRDINTDPVLLDSNPTSATLLQGRIYFAANSPNQGRELYRLDSLSGVPALVADLVPGSISSSPTALTAVGSSLVFRTIQGVQGLQDGSGAVELLVPGAPVMTLPTVVGNRVVFFLGNGGPTAFDCWSSDGKLSGTLPLSVPFSGRFIPTASARLGNEAWIAGTTEFAPRTRRVMRTDGTPQGTSEFVFQGAGQVAELQGAAGGLLVFTVEPGFGGEVLWITDGTQPGTLPLITAVAGSSWRALQAFGGQVMVVRVNPDGSESLVLTDGTVPGTQVIQGAETIADLGVLGVFGGRGVFFAEGLGGAPSGLYETDGLSHQFVAAVELAPFTRPVGATTQGFFAATDPAQASRGIELWSTDGTSAGTMRISEIRPGDVDPQLRELFTVGDQLFFAANDGLTGLEPWRSDGSASGTQRIADITPTDRTQGSRPLQFTEGLGLTWFFASESQQVVSLWSSDGTTAGTVPRSDLNPANGSISFLVGEVGNEFVFATGSPQLEVYATDGVTSRRLVSEPSRGFYTIDGDRLLFFTRPAPATFRLWEHGPAGTQELVTLTGVSDVGPPTILGGDVLFRARTTAFGDELWSLLAGGPVVDLRPGPTGSGPDLRQRLGSQVFFTADDGVSGFEMWVTDGTAAGTQRLADTVPGAGGTVRPPTAQVGGKFYFVGGGTRLNELWESGGTPATTRMVYSGQTRLTELVGQNGKVFGVAQTFDGELMVHDPATGLTELLPTRALGRNTDLVAVGDRRVMMVSFALNGAGPAQIWESDGSLAGTRAVADSPAQGMILRRDGLLVFTSDDGISGSEPFVLDPGAVAQPVPTGSCAEFAESKLTATDPILGSTMQARLDHGGQNSGGLLFAGFPARLALGSDCRLEVDLALPLLIVPIPPAPSGQTTVAFPIPNSVALAGLHLSMQAFLSPDAMSAGGPVLGYDLTNPLSLRLGR